jgi:hypothetical protein
MYKYDEQKQTLSLIYSILQKNDFLDKMHLSLGTLLGAVRQGKLNTSLNNWDDLDFSVNQENFGLFKKKIMPELEKNGFALKYVWMTSFNQIGEITFYRGNDRLDVNQLFPSFLNDEKYYIHCHWYGDTQLTKGLKASYYEEIKKINLEGLEFYGPKLSEEYLVDCYGENWKIPCKSENEYKYWEDSPGIPWWDKRKFLKMLNTMPEQ